MDGLKDSVVKMLAGSSARINTGTFSNDMTTFATKDDVLTLPVHLGYLTYDSQKESVSIPNKEVSKEYVNAISTMDWKEVITSIEASRKSNRMPFLWKNKAGTGSSKNYIKKGVKPLSQTHEMLLQEWDFLKNIEYDPSFLTAGSGKKVWWKCSTCGYEWSAAIVDRTRGMAKCKVCREQKNK